MINFPPLTQGVECIETGLLLYHIGCTTSLSFFDRAHSPCDLHKESTNSQDEGAFSFPQSETAENEGEG